jgi:hypothetical protein
MAVDEVALGLVEMRNDPGVRERVLRGDITVWGDRALTEDEKTMLRRAAHAQPEDLVAFASALRYVAEHRDDLSEGTTEEFSQYVRKAFGGAPAVACILGI